MPQSSSVPQAVESAEFRDLGDELMFYDRKGDQVHVLNETAREIYLLCDGERTEDDVARAIAEKFGIDEKTARRDTAEALEQMRQLGLLRPGS